MKYLAIVFCCLVIVLLMKACSLVGALIPCDLTVGNSDQRQGESVPVSKSPLTDDAFKYLDLSAPSVHPDVAKHFLFSGTKVIRARRPQNVDDDEGIALAIVVRTGFLTTKGALIRSMLFPKPSGFKFYRDSFRYISVMAFIAALGFVASFINFLKLGVRSMFPTPLVHWTDFFYLLGSSPGTWLLSGHLI